ILLNSSNAYLFYFRICRIIHEITAGSTNTDPFPRTRQRVSLCFLFSPSPILITMSSKVGSMLKTAVYALWSFQWGFFTATFCIYHELSIPNPFHAVLTTVLTLPIPLSLELFLLYTTASRFSCLDLHTRKFNTFFYKTRDWAMILPIFSILWFLCVLWWGLLAMMDMYSYGPVAKTVEFLCLSFKPIGYTVYIGGVLLYIPLPFWVIVTGTGACRRVRNLKSPEEEEATNLTTKNDDEEWNAFQDNRGI
ncbi:unnamed protein product, partial [Fusarium graminearum]